MYEQAWMRSKQTSKEKMLSSKILMNNLPNLIEQNLSHRILAALKYTVHAKQIIVGLKICKGGVLLSEKLISLRSDILLRMKLNA